MRGRRGIARLAAGAVVGGSVLGSFCLAALEASAQQGGPASIAVVDTHVHLVGSRPPARDFDGAVAAALAAMDQFAIERAIVMPPPQVDAQLLYDHVEIAQALRGHADRLAFAGGGGTLNAMLHRFSDASAVDDGVRRAFEAAARRIIDAGAAGFGEMASLHISVMKRHPYEFVPADHPLLRLLADVAAARAVPIELHMDAVAGAMAVPARFAEGDNPPVLPDTLAAFERLLSHNPKARIVWAHGGSDPLGAMTPVAIGALMAKHPGLFVSLRIVGAQAPMHNKLLTAQGLDPAWRSLLLRHTDRFMIGTDSFFAAAGRDGTGPGAIFGERNAPKLAAMRHALALLPAEISAAIARDNALRVYRLSR